VKTLVDPAVRALLSRQFVLAMHNQVPDLYCNNSIDPGTDRYPREQVDRCPEGAGGGNLRLFLCSPSGEIVSAMMGYWRPDRFLEELGRGRAILGARSSRADVERLHRECRARHEGSADRAEKVLIRSHQEALQDLFHPVQSVLARIEDEIYTKGAIG
jgi:hypothetical protein